MDFEETVPENQEDQEREQLPHRIFKISYILIAKLKSSQIQNQIFDFIISQISTKYFVNFS